MLAGVKNGGVDASDPPFSSALLGVPCASSVPFHCMWLRWMAVALSVRRLECKGVGSDVRSGMCGCVRLWWCMRQSDPPAVEMPRVQWQPFGEPFVIALVAALHSEVTVGEVEKECTADVTVLIRELLASCRLANPLALFTNDATVTARLLAYARSVAHFPTAMKEFPWRNGYFWDISEAAVSEGKADPTPTHSAWLKEYAPSVVPSGIASW